MPIKKMHYTCAVGLNASTQEYIGKINRAGQHCRREKLKATTTDSKRDCKITHFGGVLKHCFSAWDNGQSRPKGRRARSRVQQVYIQRELPKIR